LTFTLGLLNLGILLGVVGLMLIASSVLLFLYDGKLQALINKSRLSNFALIKSIFISMLLIRHNYGEGRFDNKCRSNALSLP
jgi:hypothetical protein